MATRKTARKGRKVRRKNDLLRELLQIIQHVIDQSDRKTRSLANIKDLRDVLPEAIGDLIKNPGGVPKKTD